MEGSMYASTIDTYQQQAVSTASPAQLVLMCYDGVLAALTRARQGGDIETRNRELQRAQAILAELRVTLDHERGGEIASSLGGLYTFCSTQLVAANVKGDLSLLDDVAEIVGDLRAAWEQACCGVVAVG
jgi:flagellar secretion chaperone FliS